MAYRFRIDRHKVRQIFVDRNAQNRQSGIWAWVAYEPNLDVCLIMRRGKEQVLERLSNGYCRRPIFTDGAYWYNTPCRWLRLTHEIYRPELKNMMEWFIQHIKDRTECCEHFSCRNLDCDRHHIKLFVPMFTWIRIE